MDTLDAIMDKALQALGEPEPLPEPTPAQIADAGLRMTTLGYMPYDRDSFRKLATYLAGEYHRQNGRGLLLWGPAGTGKTLFVRSVIQPHFMMSASDIVDEYRELQAYNHAFWNRVCGAWDSEIESLVIDDLGQEPTCVSFGQREECLDRVLCDAYKAWQARGARVWITTNLTIDELDKRYGRRVTDRLREMVVQVKFSGRSAR